MAWVYHRRHDWLEALDRRYFRERYNAQQLLGELAENLHCAGQLQDVAPVVVARIDAALHSSYVARSRRGQTTDGFTSAWAARTQLTEV